MPHDTPEELGLPVVLTHYVDVNLYHDMLIGRSVTGIIHFINQTPIELFSKKQATAKSATYRSKYVAARICVEQIIDLGIHCDTLVSQSLDSVTCLRIMNLLCIAPR